MMGWIIPIAVLAVLAALPWLDERRRHPAEAFRAKAPGRFAKLSRGVTHYQWLGPARGPIIVCVHGLTTPSPVWYAIAEGLSALGFRVLLYDLYGRGFSDAPLGVQNGAFFAEQLNELLDHQEVTEDVTILGYSMGGSVSTAFTAAYPSRVRRLIVLASGGMWLREDRLTEFARTVPFFGDWLFKVVIARKERRALRRELGIPYDIRGIVELQIAEYQSRGFLRSVLSSRRHMLDAVLEEEHKTIARADIPVVGIWAEKDDIIPLKSLGTLSQWNRTVRQEVIPGAGHEVAYSHSAKVLALLQEVLREESE